MWFYYCLEWYTENTNNIVISSHYGNVQFLFVNYAHVPRRWNSTFATSVVTFQRHVSWACTHIVAWKYTLWETLYMCRIVDILHMFRVVRSFCGTFETVQIYFISSYVYLRRSFPTFFCITPPPSFSNVFFRPYNDLDASPFSNK